MSVRQWRVPRQLLAVKAGAAVALAAVAASALDDPQFLLLAGVAAVGGAVWAARDALAPVRLAADADGVTVVRGFAGRRHIPWSEVERVRIDERAHLGIRSRLLEIETAEGPHLLSKYDLGEEPDEVAGELARIRSARPRS